MKHILYRLLFIIFNFIVFSPNTIRGKKAKINYLTNNLINSIKIEPIKKELFLLYPLSGKGKFFIDCQPGDKIITNIIIKDNNDSKNNNYFSMIITFEDNTKYYFNKNNISIYNINNKTNIDFFFYIPYETFCKNINDIIVYNNNKNIINFNLLSSIFIKNNNIQSLERLKINITEIFPSNLIINTNKINNNQTFTIFLNNYYYLHSPIIIKYTGISNTGGSLPLNECKLKIIFNDNLLYKKKDNNNSIRKIEEKEENYYFYNESIYNNSKALENIKVIERFFKQGINVFDLETPIFNDLCIYVEEDGKDVVLDDRIELYYQNYSICNSNCLISEMDMENYIYTCKCSDSVILTNENVGKTKEVDEDSFSKETLSEEISDIFFETNFEVLSCFIKLFTVNIYMNNIGAIMTTTFIIIQSVAGIFLFKQIKDIRVYLYSDVIKGSDSKCNLNPPLKKGNNDKKEEVEKQIESGSNKNMNIIINNDITPNDLYNNSIVPKNKRNKKIEFGSELSSRKGLISHKSNVKIFDNMIDEKIKNNLLFNGLVKSGKINQPIKKIYPMKDLNYLKENAFPFFESENSSQRKIESRKHAESIYTPKVRIPKNLKYSKLNVRRSNHHFKYDENELKYYIHSQKTLPQNKIEENKRYSKKKKNEEEKYKYEENSEKNSEKINFEEEDEYEKELKIDKKNLHASNKGVIKLYLLAKNKYAKNAIMSDNYAENTDRQRKKEKEKDKPKVKIRKCKTKKSDFRRRRTEGWEKKKERKLSNVVQVNAKREYDEEDLNELDFNEAVIYDHRGFWELCWMEMKERQLIINTFFVKEKLKPFTNKLIVFIFSITCYFVINGFLYDTNYVSKRLKRKNKSIYFFFVDSIKRIIYSSLVGVLVNVIMGLLFRSDKTLRKAHIKYKDNRILLNGEVVKIFKNMKITNFLFTIVNFICMVVIWIYLFCFCGVYRNCQLDWIESTGIIIGVMQMLPILISFLLAVLRIIGLRCGIESCFRITAWISDNT